MSLQELYWNCRGYYASAENAPVENRNIGDTVWRAQWPRYDWVYSREKVIITTGRLFRGTCQLSYIYLILHRQTEVTWPKISPRSSHNPLIFLHRQTSNFRKLKNVKRRNEWEDEKNSVSRSSSSSSEVPGNRGYVFISESDVLVHKQQSWLSTRRDETKFKWHKTEILVEISIRCREEYDV